MASNLISPGVSVNIIDQSFYVSGIASSVPLFFVATADQKLQSDGVSPALGTYDYGVLREVTSVQQSQNLFGTPRFLTSPTGEAYHGDARNEYGLDAMNKALEVVDRVYVIRANVNLDDSIESIQGLWERNISDAADYLNTLVQSYIDQSNTANGFLPSDPGYVETVTGEELKTLVNEALADTLASFSFSSQKFQNAFIQDHDVPHAGYQDVLFTTSGGFLQLSDITGLLPASRYSADVEVVSGTGTQVVSFSLLGSQAVTFGDLVSYLTAHLGAAGSAQLLNGRLRLTSSLAGVTSSVNIIADGVSGSLPLFASLNLYQSLDVPVDGTGSGALNVYDSSYETIVGSYTGLDDMIDSWTSGNVVPDEFTAAEAEGLLSAASSDFEFTNEFKNYTVLGANDAARRAAIVKALQAAINDPSSGVTSDALDYNVVACPGYFETSDELVRLSQSVRSEVFVVGETPFDKAPTGPSGITTWAVTPARTNSNLIGYWYGHGISSNLDGADIMTTAGSTAIRTILYSDSVGELWYAPAGVTRGTCPHLTNVGYVTGTLGGVTTFTQNYLDDGTRDSLYATPKNINPITFIPGRGILVMGQKTSQTATSALDRINVERMTLYIKRQLRQALFSFLFEPNDKQTWDAVKSMVDNFMSTLVSRRGLYDYLVVCDASNNTGATIDNNELHVAVYIKPVKAVEFIYVDVTLVNTGTDLSGSV
jgi:hypothetical protein